MIDNRQGNTSLDELAQVSQSKVAYTDTRELPVLLRVTYSAPALLPGFWAAQRSVYEIQVDFPAFFERRIDGFLGSRVSLVRLQLSREEYVRTGDVFGLAKIGDGLAAFFFILVPRCRVLFESRSAFALRRLETETHYVAISGLEQLISQTSREKTRFSNSPPRPITLRCTRPFRPVRMFLYRKLL